MGLIHNMPLGQMARQDKRAINLERQMHMAFPTSKGQAAPASDPYSTVIGQKLDLGREPHLLYGRIVDSVPYCHFYKVQLERFGSVIAATPMTQGGLEVMGAKASVTYTLGAGVYVLWHPHMTFGVIMGAVPDFMLAANDALSDWVSQGSNVGLNVDAVNKFPFNLESGGGISDWSAGRFFDSIGVGEWGAITETGLSMFLDPAMFMMRVDEETGVYGFYDDQLLRVAGHNLEMRSAGYDRVDHDDEEEFNSIQGSTPYLWEARGGFTTLARLYREVADKNVQQNTPYYSHLEPALDNQQAMHRYREFMGYLGQGKKKSLFILCDPVTHGSQDEITTDPVTGSYTISPFDTKVLAFDDVVQFPGVAEENWALDGQISMRSAKGIILSKRLLQPEPKRLKLDEDTSGDTTATYKANGVYGSGPAHKIGDIEMPIGNHSLVRAAGFLDCYAHTFNWKGLHPFHYHAADWYTPEEDDYSFSGDMASGNPPFDALKTCQYLLAPVPLRFKVDDRYGQVVYFPNDSFIALLEDGGIVIGDGYGAEIRMTAGSHFRSCPGDIWDLPGRNHLSLSGQDFIARANWNVELSANQCDVRVKAQKNVLIMGGNDICGGVLIESRSPGTGFDTFNGDGTAGAVICQTGGEKTSMSVTVNDAACCPGNPAGETTTLAKDYYTIKVTTAALDGLTATADVISSSGTDDVAGVGLSLSTVSIGTKGLTVTFSGGTFAKGQTWVAMYSRDCNDTNEEGVGGIILRAKKSAVVSYAKHIHAILPPDGTGGSIVLNAQRAGQIIEHAKHVVRHIENDAQDVLWSTDTAVVTIIVGGAAVPDGSKYFGKTITYTINCTYSEQQDPITLVPLACYVRLDVISSDGLDDTTGVIPAPYGSPTKIGNRGFEVTFTGGLLKGDTFTYHLEQVIDPKVNEYRRDFTLIDTKLSIHDDFFTKGKVLAKGDIHSVGNIYGVTYPGPNPGPVIAAESVHDTRDTTLQAWARQARPAITALQDSTDVIKLEFFFRSSHQDETEPSWQLYEGRWQQMARYAGAGTSPWLEKDVIGQDAFAGVTSHPHPGRWMWALYKGYFQEDLGLFNLTSNLSQPRGGGLYEMPAYQAPSDFTMQGSYPVIKT